MTSVRLEPAAPRSRVKNSTTEPLCSLKQSHNNDFGGLDLKRFKQHDTHHCQDLVTSNKDKNLSKHPIIL